MVNARITTGVVQRNVLSDLNLINVKLAKTQAKAENKKILLDFTGSDWCGWCKKLEAEVFSQQAWKDYAAKHLVLVELDFPVAVGIVGRVFPDDAGVRIVDRDIAVGFDDRLNPLHRDRLRAQGFCRWAG